MKDLLQKFVRILRIELEDLEQDIGDLLEICQRRRDSTEITNYVYLENKSLLLEELAGIKGLLHSLDSLDTTRFRTDEELFKEVDRLVQDKTRECSYPEAVYSLVKRRLDKVIAYLRE